MKCNICKEEELVRIFKGWAICDSCLKEINSIDTQKQICFYEKEDIKGDITVTMKPFSSQIFWKSIPLNPLKFARDCGFASLNDFWLYYPQGGTFTVIIKDPDLIDYYARFINY